MRGIHKGTVEFIPTQEEVFKTYSSQMEKWAKDDKEGNLSEPYEFSAGRITKWKSWVQNGKTYKQGDLVVLKNKHKNDMKTLTIAKIISFEKDYTSNARSDQPFINYYIYDNERQTPIKAKLTMYIEHCSVDLKKRYEKYLEDKKADSICIVKYNGNNDNEPVEVPPVDNGQRNVTKVQEEIGSDNVIQYISCVLKNKRGNKLDKTEGKNYCIFIRKKIKKMDGHFYKD